MNEHREKAKRIGAAYRRVVKSGKACGFDIRGAVNNVNAARAAWQGIIRDNPEMKPYQSAFFAEAMGA